MNNNDLEQAASYMMLFALSLLGATLIGLALGLIRIGLDLMGIANNL